VAGAILYNIFMKTLEIFLIALGLAMDAFAVSIASGATMKKLELRNALKMGLFFGGFQTLMPVIGWFAGIGMKSFITGWDHWLAFGLLTLVGGKMIYEAMWINLDPAVQNGSHRNNKGTDLSCRIPREAGGGPSAMRAGPDEVYSSRRAPAMRAESCNCNFQVKGDERQAAKKCPFDTGVLLILALATSIDALAVGITFSVLSVSIILPVITIGLVTFVLSAAGVQIGVKGGHFFENKIEIAGGLILIGIGTKILISHL